MIFLHYAARFIWCVFILIAFILSGLGFWYQLPGGTTLVVAIITIWALLGLFLLIAEWRSKPWMSRCLAIALLCGFSIWWSTISPSLNRDWAPELMYTVTADLQDLHHIKVDHIRDFDWQTPEGGKASWISETYDIDQIVGMDMYMSYWMGPYIAHTLVGFTFSDGRHLVFSAEIRREKTESFSAIGGFFKEFELAMIAATEEDIIKLRSDIRQENIFRYPLLASKDKMQELFVTYLNTGNHLAKKPKFYNTLTTNCTTVVFDMARIFDPGLPLDWRILFSGQLPAYLYDHKFIETDMPLIDVVKKSHITPQNNVPRYEYSKAIRTGDKAIDN